MFPDGACFCLLWCFPESQPQPGRHAGGDGCRPRPLAVTAARGRGAAEGRGPWWEGQVATETPLTSWKRQATSQCPSEGLGSCLCPSEGQCASFLMGSPFLLALHHALGAHEVWPLRRGMARQKSSPDLGEFCLLFNAQKAI